MRILVFCCVFIPILICIRVVARVRTLRTELSADSADVSIFLWQSKVADYIGSPRLLIKKVLTLYRYV